MLKFYVNSHADIFCDELASVGLNLMPSKYKMEDEICEFEGFSKEADIQKIYKAVKEGKVSIVPFTEKEIIKFFEPVLKNGDDVLYFSLAFPLLMDNGTALESAFKKLRAKYPSRRAEIIDTRTVSRGICDIAVLTKKFYEKNPDINSAINYADSLSGTFVSAIALNDIKTAAKYKPFEMILNHISGTSLNIKLILGLNTDAQFNLLGKTRSFKAAVKNLNDIARQNGENIADYTFSIVYFDAKSEAESLFQSFLIDVSPSEIQLVPLSVNNAVILGGKCVGITFHSKF